MNNFQEGNRNEEETLNLGKLLGKLGDKWFWFVISVVISLCCGFAYLKFTTPTYQIFAKILVNDDEKGGGLGKQAGALLDFGGLIGGKNSVDNEAEILKTRFLMEQVVNDLQLNIVYGLRENFVNKELYRSPFKVIIIKGIDSIKSTKIELHQLSKEKIKVVTDGFEKELTWGQSFTIKSVGQVKLERNYSINISNDITYFASISSLDERVARLMNQLSVAVSNKQVTIIDLGLSYNVPKKGEDILNALIRKYTQANLSDKNAIADSTYQFIKERLTVIASELGDVENKVEQFKEKNQLADMTEQGKMLVQNTSEFASDLAKSETQVSILSDLENYLKDGNKNKRVFPSSLLPQDMVFSNLMSQYNALLVERERQLLSVTTESPFIKNIDIQIAGLRSDILSNIETSKNTYIRTRDKLRSQLNTAEGRISGVPQIEKNYLKLARNQQIKQELYIFLMQKAEETAISKTSNMAIAKIIDPPKSEVLPINPKKNVVYLTSIIIGLTIPILLILSLYIFNTTVSTKEDITSLTQVPVIGEISHNISGDNLIVASQSRSAISEQFRALRTNLSFYLKTADEKVILLTSSMSGEGKSFTAINLGNILALSGKKVLLMELDLRKPGLSAKLNTQNTVGFSNYAISPDLDLKDIIRPLTINPNMFILSSGPLPPNPAETLMFDGMSDMMIELKSQFDYIIMDAPPVGIITDAQLLAPYADATIYLIRQKVTKKEQVKYIDDLYKSAKMKNLGIVVNDIVPKYYGYGYGYGTYGEETKTGFISGLINRLK